jgi:hypothetical protein
LAPENWTITAVSPLPLCAPLVYNPIFKKTRAIAQRREHIGGTGIVFSFIVPVLYFILLYKE